MAFKELVFWKKLICLEFKLVEFKFVVELFRCFKLSFKCWVWGGSVWFNGTDAVVNKLFFLGGNGGGGLCGKGGGNNGKGGGGGKLDGGAPFEIKKFETSLELWFFSALDNDSFFSLITFKLWFDSVGLVILNFFIIY